MASKDIKFGQDARDRMLRGVDILCQCSEGHARTPRVVTSCSTSPTAHHASPRMV